MNGYKEGLSKGVAMNDMEILRFYNGCLAAMPASALIPTRDPMCARKGVGEVMDALASHGMVAFVGAFGIPEIRTL